MRVKEGQVKLRSPPSDAAAVGDHMQRLSKPLLVMIALAMVSEAAHARSLQITGTAGYLSEWELNGAVTEGISSGNSVFSGPLTWKHVGLCSANGPEEKHGEIRFQVDRSGSLSRIDATISLGSIQCTYSGRSDGSGGHMDCSDAKDVPLSISIR
jgi:hypothetical protein